MTIALDATTKNTKYSISTRLQVKQLNTKLISNFNSNDQTTARLAYLTQQTYLIYQSSPFLDSYIEQSSVGSFGYVSDVLFCSRIVCLQKHF